MSFEISSLQSVLPGHISSIFRFIVDLIFLTVIPNNLQAPSLRFLFCLFCSFSQSAFACHKALCLDGGERGDFSLFIHSLFSILSICVFILCCRGSFIQNFFFFLSFRNKFGEIVMQLSLSSAVLEVLDYLIIVDGTTNHPPGNKIGIQFYIMQNLLKFQTNVEFI